MVSSVGCCIVLVLITLASNLNVLANSNKAGTVVNTTCVGGGGGGGGGVRGGAVHGSLRYDYYFGSCPIVEEVIFSFVENAVANEPRMAASLLRLHFHDCFVNGCDGSVLLDDTPTLVGEKTAPPNLNSLRGFNVIDQIKMQLEDLCPGTVSCADIVATAARDSIVLLGGPTWEMEMGRLDRPKASKTEAANNLPGPNSDVPTLISKFQNVGLSTSDMVALSGAHTIGKARCSSFRARLKPRTNPHPFANTAFLNSLQQVCLGGNSTLTELDLATPETFDNQYYINLLSGQGLLNSDQTLVSGDSEVIGLVKTYADDIELFFEDFKNSMLRMGRLMPAQGTHGEIRRNCRFIN